MRVDGLEALLPSGVAKPLKPVQAVEDGIVMIMVY